MSSGVAWLPGQLSATASASRSSDHPGQGVNIHGLCAGSPKGFRTFIHRGSRGEDVIHEHQGFALDGRGDGDGETPSKIFETLAACQGRLRRCENRPLDEAGRNGEMPLPAQMAGQQQRLVKFPFPESPGVQRHSENGINVGRRADSPGDQLRERGGQLGLAVVL